ncbi:MAG: hypothetical protein M1825_002065 [Sarcosagium campestre]|nr:MAG: hypothetical protein M1825_002065 [Sarcosagium campestre]
MTPTPPKIPLTIIVAITHARGIGIRGGLPWPPLTPDMVYFSRVTTRVPPAESASTAASDVQNAVIMGRRTWESIPKPFRPLRGRLNVVISRGGGDAFATSSRPGAEVLGAVDLSDAVRRLQERRSQGRLGRTFVIGGAEVYKAALEANAGFNVERLLVTRVRGDWECDVYFPHGVVEGSGWKKASSRELETWTQESTLDGLKEYKGVAFEFEMWERTVDSSIQQA